MILQALTRCYEELLKKNKVPPKGWNLVKTNFVLELFDDGSIKQVYPLENLDAKKKIYPMTLQMVPEQTTRTSGIAAQFLCDNAAYIFGADKKEKAKRALNCFAASKALHLEILSDVHSPAAEAVKNYFLNWQPEKLKSSVSNELYEHLISRSVLIFMYDDEYVHEDDEVRDAWEKYYAAHRFDQKGQCLVTGRYDTLCRLHPLIKGIWGGQPSGAPLVSSNTPAYQSYGQEENSTTAPVSDYAGFAYTTALNYMLQREEYTLHLGDMTIVYWAEGLDRECNVVFNGAVKCDVNQTEINQTELNTILNQAGNTEYCDYQGKRLRFNNKFYILGLAPNIGRISVKFFFVDTFGNILSNVAQHYKDLEIIKPAFAKFNYLPLWLILSETVNKNAKDKEKLYGTLAPGMLKAVLGGRLYPQSLLQRLLQRIYAEPSDSANYVKASAIKAFLNRQMRLKNYLNQKKEEITVALNEQTAYVPYVLGRLFAVYENLQDRAGDGSINTTIKDRFFNSAMSMPATIFPILSKLSNVHLRKLEKGEKIYFEKQIIDLVNKLEMGSDPAFPKRLNLEEQSYFYLGYYHQVQKRYTKKEEVKND